jgi:hypothetical protein
MCFPTERKPPSLPHTHQLPETSRSCSAANCNLCQVNLECAYSLRMRSSTWHSESSGQCQALTSANSSQWSGRTLHLTSRSQLYRYLLITTTWCIRDRQVLRAIRLRLHHSLSLPITKQVCPSTASFHLNFITIWLKVLKLHHSLLPLITQLFSHRGSSRCLIDLVRLEKTMLLLLLRTKW